MDRIRILSHNRTVRGYDIDDVKNPYFDWLNYRLNTLEYLAMIQNYLTDKSCYRVPIQSRQSVKLINHERNGDMIEDEQRLIYINGGHANYRDVERGTFFYKPLFYGGYLHIHYNGHDTYNLLFYYGCGNISMVSVNEKNAIKFNIIEYMSGEYLFSEHTSVVFSIRSNFYENSCLGQKMFNDMYRYREIDMSDEPTWYSDLFYQFHKNYIETYDITTQKCTNASMPLVAVRRNTHILNYATPSEWDKQIQENEKIFNLSLTNYGLRKQQIQEQWKNESV